MEIRMVERRWKRQKPRPARSFQNAEQGLQPLTEIGGVWTTAWSELLPGQRQEARSGPLPLESKDSRLPGSW